MTNEVPLFFVSISASELDSDAPKPTCPSPDSGDTQKAPVVAVPSESKEQMATLGERTFNCCYPGKERRSTRGPRAPWGESRRTPSPSGSLRCARTHTARASSVGPGASCPGCDSPELRFVAAAFLEVVLYEERVFSFSSRLPLQNCPWHEGFGPPSTDPHG